MSSAPNQRNFILDLARSGDNAKIIEDKVKAVYKDSAYNRSQIYRLIALAKSAETTEELASQRGRGTKKTVRVHERIEEVRALIEADHHLTCLLYTSPSPRDS